MRKKISKNGRFVYDSETETYVLENTLVEYENVYGEWKKVEGQEEKKEKVPLEDVGFTKTFKGFYLIRREAISTYSLLPMRAFFKQYFTLKIRRRRDLKHVYLKKEGISLYVRDFSKEGYGVGRGNVTHGISLIDLKTREDLFNFQAIGKPKRIAQDKLEALKRDKGFIGIFTENERQQIVEKRLP